MSVYAGFVPEYNPAVVGYYITCLKVGMTALSNIGEYIILLFQKMFLFGIYYYSGHHTQLLYVPRGEQNIVSN